jgi:hypothetical protein
MATPEARAIFLVGNVAADLLFLWEDSGVSELHQYKLGQIYGSVRKWSAYADSRTEVRTAVKADFALDGAVSPLDREQVACIVMAWEASLKFVEKEGELKAEAKTLGSAPLLSLGDKTAMTRALVASFGKRPERELPSAEYLAFKLEQIENGDFKASTLDAVVSKLEQSHSSEDLAASFDHQGRMRVTHKRHKGSLPANSEEFRLKLKIESNLWLMVASKLKSAPWLKGLCPQDFLDYADFILGERVLGIKKLDPISGSSAPLSPPWAVVLGYDAELRQEAWRRVEEDPGGITISAALKQVVKDPEIKNLFFIEVLAIGGNKRKAPEPSLGSADLAAPPLSKTARKKQAKASRLAAASVSSSGDGGVGTGNAPKGGGKGKGKGGGKGKGKGNGWCSTTPDGRRLCFAYNNGESCGGSCGMVHACRVTGCYSTEHPAIRHVAA